VRKKAGRAKDAPWSQAFESSMLRKIELGRGLDVQLSEKKSFARNEAPGAADRRPRLLRSLTNPVALLLIVTSSASLIIPLACFAYFAKNTSHFAQIGLAPHFLFSLCKMRPAKAKDGVVGLPPKAYVIREDYEY
jgi:hypothetical protein